MHIPPLMALPEKGGRLVILGGMVLIAVAIGLYIQLLGAPYDFIKAPGIIREITATPSDSMMKYAQRKQAESAYFFVGGYFPASLSWMNLVNR